MSKDEDEGIRERDHEPRKRWWIVALLSRLRLTEEIIPLPEEDWHDDKEDDE
jgi:hypothetical protein